MERRGAWIAAAGVAVTALIVGVVFLLTRRDNDDKTTVDVVSDSTAVGQVVVTVGATLPTTTTPTTPPTTPPSTVPTTTTTTITTVPATTTSTTTTTTTTTTTLPPTTVPTTPPAPPGRLDVKVHELDLGPTTSAGTVSIVNIGGRPIGWSTSSDNGLVQAPGGGTLGPGAVTRLLISVSRAGLIEGDYTGVVSIVGGGRSLPVTVHWSVERPPVVQLDVKPPGLDDAGTCPKGSPALTAVVTAAVIDESPVASAVMAWTGPGPGGELALTASAPGTWTAPLGPLTGAGSWSVTVTATDSRGNVGTGSTTLEVSACTH